MRAQRLSCLLAAALLSILACACANKPSAETTAPIGPLPPPSFARQWSSDLQIKGGDDVTALHVRDDTLFVYTRSGRVVALGRADGKFLFAAQIRGGSNGVRPPVILSENIVFPTLATLEVYEKDGTVVRSVPLKFAVSSDAVGSGQSLYVGGDFAGSGRATALDLTKRYVPARWELMIPGGVAAAPALQGATVYFAGRDGNVYALAAEDRQPLWAGLPGSVFHTDGPIVAGLWVDESGVYAASTDTKLYCINKNNGKRKWQYFAGKALTQGPVATPDTLYLPVPGTGLLAFDKAEGEANRKPKWIDSASGQLLAQDKDNTYVRHGNSIVALDKNTGQRKFASKRNDFAVFGTNTKGDGTIYAVTRAGIVLAINPVLQSGAVGEQVRGTHAPSAPTLAAAR